MRSPVRMTVHAQQFAGEIARGFNACVDSLRLPREVRVKRARNDAAMAAVGIVQSDEVTAVQSEQCAGVCGSERQHVLVRHRLAGLSGFLNRHGVMLKFAEFLDDLPREVLIGVQACQSQASSFARICSSISAR